MGASSSTDSISMEERELESEAASTGSLSLLRNSFSLLADHTSNSIPLSSLQQCFSLKYTNITCEGAEVPDCFPGFLDQMAASIVETLFVPQKEGTTWAEFVKGYVRCCGRMSVSSLLNVLFRVLALSAERAGWPLNLTSDSDEVDSKMSGSISPKHLGMILWVCWIMSWNSRSLKQVTESNDLNLPDLSHLVLSAVESCTDNGTDVAVSDCDVFKLEVELTIGKLHMWALRTVPNLADCFSQYINSRLKKVAAPEHPDGAGTSSISVEDTSSTRSHLLTRGRAWGLALSQTSSISEEIFKICFPCNNDVIRESLLYKSTRGGLYSVGTNETGTHLKSDQYSAGKSYVHGKGMNRFWSNVEGYHGPLLLLLSATPGEYSKTSSKWIIGAMTNQGLENRDVFYGSGGRLYSIYPVFRVFLTSGKEHNYVYSHCHPAGKAYDPHPKPVGIGFGGTTGNDRIFIDEDFSKVTVRHHAVDKTYQHGSLFPDQGFLPAEATVLEVEVWGLGGAKAKEVQSSYKKREDLFTEQRRTIDLKTFTNWEDSPEKLMMDMMSNPNTVRREDR